MKQIIILLMVFAAINCKAQEFIASGSLTANGACITEYKHPTEKAKELPDSTIIGYDFISQESQNGRVSYSALSSKYQFLDRLAKADRMIRGFRHVDNLFTWVFCSDLDVECFNEQFMRIVVDTNRWTSRSDYNYDRHAPIYYIDFKNSYLQSVLNI